MLQERERQKEEQVEALKRSMQSGMVCLFDKSRNIILLLYFNYGQYVDIHLSNLCTLLIFFHSDA